ncbi:uncharacterized protein EAE97_005565 [Botrytis byssoidea]|uniref:Uncharacterized protein n=1 Tax=Botrytis byssoidea TaxID=139641 RepID=A0A9P5IKR2_9HELO|nr:uncharacterized protein EAE97_005565 [Botrytis byssoidea]KAF7944932.1 hypothetical protein EAE97_005565 [Botrytis byssoidea]
MANINHQPGMGNSVTQLNLAFRISLQPQHPIDIRADEACASFNTPQNPLLSGNYTVVDIGVFSRQGIFAWVRGIIHELQSYNLHTVNLVPALWGQLFKIIQNHSSFKRWIFSRPRPGPMGFLTFVHDPSEELQYTAENVLGRARIIWQEIEADLMDEEPNQFVGEIFRQVYHIWQYKCYMNNMLRDLTGQPRTTDRDGFLELVRYKLPRQMPPHPNHPAPAFPTLVPAAALPPALQPARPPQNPVGANTGIVGHASIIGNPGHNPIRRAGNTRIGARQSTGMSVAAGSLVISDSQSSGQSDDSNPAFNQPYALMPTADPNAGRMISTLMVSHPAFAHGPRRANPTVSSAMPNAVQTGRPNVVQAGGPNAIQAGSSNVPATSGPQNKGNQQNGNPQGNRQPRLGLGAAMEQSRPPQPNLRRRRSSTRTQCPQRVPVFNSANSDSSTAGPVVTQKRPANTNSNASSLAGPSRPSGKKIKMENADADR